MSSYFAAVNAYVCLSSVTHVMGNRTVTDRPIVTMGV